MEKMQYFFVIKKSKWKIKNELKIVQKREKFYKKNRKRKNKVIEKTLLKHLYT